MKDVRPAGGVGNVDRPGIHPHLSEAAGIRRRPLTTAFVPEWYEASDWRHYRGGRTHPISVMNLADYSVEKLPWSNSNDTLPMWIGNTIYSLSDRSHTVNLFGYRSDTKQVSQLTHHDDFDIMTASAGSDANPTLNAISYCSSLMSGWPRG